MVIGIILGAVLGIIVTASYMMKVPAIIISSTNLVPLTAEPVPVPLSTSWVAPEGTTSTEPYMPSEALMRALHIIDDATTTVRGYELGDHRVALLVSKESHRLDDTKWFLWNVYSPEWGTYVELQKTFSADVKDVSLTKDGDQIVLGIIRLGWADWYHGYDYYRFRTNGGLEFAFEMDNPDQAAEGATIRDGFGTYSVKLVFSPSCESKNADLETASTTLTGIQIADKVYPLPPTALACAVSGDMFFSFAGPTPIFKEYDPFYQTLTLELPDRRSILIDVYKKRIVASKEKYNAPCLVKGEPLTFTTPSGTTMLLSEITDDKVLAAEGLGALNCLSFQGKAKNSNPIFNLEANFGEGFGDLGSFEFDLKVKKFKKR